MRKEIKDKLDLDFKRSKRKKLYVSLMVGAGFIGFILILAPFLPASTTNIQGVSVKLTAVQTDEGNFPKMFVRLDSDITVRASMPRKLEFIKGARVNILKMKSIMGINSYKVIGYAKPNT
jgi:hypothetical protein